MKKRDTVKEINNFFILYLLLGQSSMPFLVGDVFLIFGFLYAFFLFLYRNQQFDKELFQYSFIFFIIFLVHVTIGKIFIYSVFIAFFLRIFFAYFVIKLLSEKFPFYFVKIIVFFAIISLIIYIPLVISSNFQNYLLTYITPFFYKYTYFKDYQHLIVFTINLGSNSMFPRNPGPFWEAGGFGIFLNLALLFNLIRTKIILNKTNFILLLTVLTTQSTGTYITSFTILISFFAFARRISYLLLLLPALVYIGYLLFYQLPFLNDKMNNEIENVSVSDYKHSPRTRLISARVDYDDFLTHPLFGKGRFRETNVKAEDYQSSEEYRNNGTTQLLAEFGIIGFLTYFFFVFKSFKYYCLINKFSPNYSFIIVMVLWLAGFSQGIFTKPFFFSFCFLFLGFVNGERKYYGTVKQQ